MSSIRCGKLVKLVPLLAGVVVVCGWAARARCAQQEDTKYQMMQKFDLLSIIMEQEVGIITTRQKGKICWLERDANGLKFDLKVERVSQEFERPETESLLLTRPQPFTANVVFSKDEDVPVSVEITQGKVNHQKDRYGLGEQYAMVNLISEMMMATVEKEFVVARRGESTRLRSKLAEKMRVCEFGVRDTKAYRRSIAPDEFMVFPRLWARKSDGSDLISFSHTEGSVSYYYRLLGKNTGLATRAVDFRGTMKEEKEKGDYPTVVEIIDDPHKFSSYRLHELEVTDVK